MICALRKIRLFSYLKLVTFTKKGVACEGSLKNLSIVMYNIYLVLISLELDNAVNCPDL